MILLRCLNLSIVVVALLGVTTNPSAGLAQSAESSERILKLDGTRNLRDLGGYITEDGLSVRWGKLYRSDNLANLSVADKVALQARNITAVIDFRSAMERSMAETDWTANGTPEILLHPIGGTAADWSVSLARFLRTGDFSDDDIRNTFLDLYRTIPSHATSEYRALFDVILKDDGAVLFHCTAGKDRTGIAAALILSALGVPRHVIVRDYMLTNAAVDANHSVERMASAFGARLQRDLDPDSMFPLVGVEEEYLNVMFDSIEADYGSVGGYLERGLKLANEDITALKQLLLVETAY